MLHLLRREWICVKMSRDLPVAIEGKFIQVLRDIPVKCDNSRDIAEALHLILCTGINIQAMQEYVSRPAGIYIEACRKLEKNHFRAAAINMYKNTPSGPTGIYIQAFRDLATRISLQVCSY